MRFPIAASLAASAFLALFASPAVALMQLTFEEVGDNVVASYSGNLLLDGYISYNTINAGYYADITPERPKLVRFAATSEVYLFSYDFEWAAYGTGSYATTYGVSGDVFGFAKGGGMSGGNGNVVYVPKGYSFGDELSGSFTFAGVGLADLGLTAGVHTYALPSDLIVLNVKASPVPLPAAAPLLAVSLGGLAFAARRRRRG